MRNLISEFFKDRQIKRLSFINGLFLIIFVTVLIWRWSQLPPQQPLFYSLPRGNEQLGTPFKLLILPFFAVLISVFNFYLAMILHEKERLAAIILVVMATTSSFLLLITFVKIILLVT